MALTDPFTRADSGDLGASWDAGYFNACQIVGNRVRVTAVGNESFETYNVSSPTNNQYAKITLATFNAATTGEIYGGVLLRWAAPTTATGYRFSARKHTVDGQGRAWIYSYVAGVGSLVTSANVDWTSSDVLEGRAVGSALNLLKNGSSVASGTNSVQISGRAGINIGCLSPASIGDVEDDDWEAGDIPSVSHRASIAGSGNTTTSVTLVIPASTVANDIVVASFTNGGATADPTVADNEGAGTWAKILSGNNGTSNLSVWWKRASSSTAGKTITGSVFTNSCTGGASVYSGCKLSGNPYGGQTYESNASGDESHASITPTVNGSMVCLTVGQAPDLATSTQAATSPAVLIERTEHLSTGGADSAVMHASEVQVTAGATGALTWAQNNQATMSIAWYMIPEVAATAFEIDAAAGSYAISGTAALLAAGRTFNAEAGSYAVSGAAAILACGRFINAETGSYALSGAAASLLGNRALLADPGALAITGANATLAAGLMFNAEAGSYEITGADATLSKGFVIVAESGTYVLTGTAASLLADRMIEAEAGSYEITGAEATFNHGYNLNAESGVYAITGVTATLLANRVLSADAGSYLITGAAATLLADRILNAELGSYIITGIDAELILAVPGIYTLEADPGIYTLVGADATLLATRLLNAESGAYLVVGAEAALLADRILNAVAGVYEVTGADAAFLAEHMINAGPGVYALTGSDVEFEFSGQAPGTGSGGNYIVYARRRGRR
jgi:hypothetical protein